MKFLPKSSFPNHISRYIHYEIKPRSAVNKYQNQNGPEWGREAQNELAGNLRKQTKAELKRLDTSVEATKILETEIKRGDTVGALVLGLLGKTKFNYSLPVTYLSKAITQKRYDRWQRKSKYPISEKLIGGCTDKTFPLNKIHLIYPGQIIRIRLEGDEPKVFILDNGQDLPESAVSRVERAERERIARDEAEKKCKEKEVEEKKQRKKKEKEAASAAEQSAVQEETSSEQREVVSHESSTGSESTPQEDVPSEMPKEIKKQVGTRLKNAVNADQFVDMSYTNLPELLKNRLADLKKEFQFTGPLENLWDALEKVMDDDFGEDDTLELTEMLTVLKIKKRDLSDSQKIVLAQFMQAVEATSGEKVAQYLGDRAEKINTDTYSMQFFDWMAGDWDAHDLSQVPVANIPIGLTRGIEKAATGIIGLAGIDLNPNSEGLFKVPDILNVANGAARLFGVNFEPGKDWIETPLLARIGELGEIASSLGTRLETVYDKEGFWASAFDVTTVVGELLPPAALVAKIGKARALAGVRRVGAGAENGARALGRGAQRVGQGIRTRVLDVDIGSISRSAQGVGERIRRVSNRRLRLKRRLEGGIQNRSTLINEINTKITSLDNWPLHEIQADIKSMTESLKEMHKQKSEIGLFDAANQKLFRKQMQEIDDYLERFQRANRKKLLEEKSSGMKAWKESWLSGDMSATVGKRIEAYKEVLRFMKDRKRQLSEIPTKKLADDIQELNAFMRDIDKYIKDNHQNLTPQLKESLKRKKDELKQLRDEFNTVKSVRNAAQNHLDDMRQFIAKDIKKADLDKMKKSELDQKLSDLNQKHAAFDQYLDLGEITERTRRILKRQRSTLEQRRIYTESLIQARVAHMSAMREGLKRIEIGQKIKIGDKVFTVDAIGNNFSFDLVTKEFKGKLTIKKANGSISEWKMKEKFSDEAALEKITSIT